MSEANLPVKRLEQYERLIADRLRALSSPCPLEEDSNAELIARGTVASRDDARGAAVIRPNARGQIRIERGIVYARAMTDASSLKLIPPLGDVSMSSNVTDRSGHARSVYAGLLIYSYVQTCQIATDANCFVSGDLSDALLASCEALAAALSTRPWSETGVPASGGSAASGFAWGALAIAAGSRLFGGRSWLDIAAKTFAALHAGPERSTFLIPSAADNPETFWYHELTILHAASTYSILTGDRTLAGALSRSTEFHLNETQPDHATAQPWGLFAFIDNPNTQMLADQMLHAMALQHPSAMDAVSLMLLADALYCLRRLH